VELERASRVGEVVMVDEEFIVGAEGEPFICVDNVCVVCGHYRSDDGCEWV
jgi:hypothetical protein